MAGRAPRASSVVAFAVGLASSTIARADAGTDTSTSSSTIRQFVEDGGPPVRFEWAEGKLSHQLNARIEVCYTWNFNEADNIFYGASDPDTGAGVLENETQNTFTIGTTAWG